ncbi:MAG: hypothetical protein EZS28_001365 [Streblomastix strix]|uniref:EF-hand domain-containing protein n=1 Tax=Streblomastix strix TaxID=222440 RepID=A0A5J4X8K7_9EUKA|nr:MAG: hypothetical protein EZS28_001365 [Streblomastix strix]
MSNVYIDEGLLDAAGLSDFPELYAYIKERYPKPIGELPQPVPIGDQTLQQQVKNNNNIIYTSGDSNEEFVQPVPNTITKLDLSSQLERQSFLASSGSDPKLIVNGDKIILIAPYATTGLFLKGYLFKSYPAEVRPKLGDQEIALQYKSSKKINYDENNDGKIDITDIWNVNGKGSFEAQSYVYETVKKQTDLIEAGVQGLNRINYLNSEIKLMDELPIYKADRAAYLIKDGPLISYSFGAKLAQLEKKVLPPNTKYMPIHVEQQEFSAMCLFKDIYDKSSAILMVVNGQLNMLDCELQGTYILDNYANSTNANESA